MQAMHHTVLRIAEWRHFKSERGVTAVEYAMIGGITVLAIVGALTLVGTRLSTVFSTLAPSL